MLILHLLLPLIAAKQDCVPGAWNEWSSCTELCGVTGTRERSRRIDVLPTTDGFPCHQYEFHGVQPCNRMCNNGGAVTDTKCDCRIGYTGTCCEIDVDECDNANGGCQQSCRNTHGSFVCECWDGFEMNQFGACSDINECEDGSAGCEKLCMNFPAGYSCGCVPPKILEMDGKSCADENYCLTNPSAFNCSHHCVIHNNRFQCSCPYGYTLDEVDGFLCLDDDECADPHYCVGGTCINLNGTGLCECGVGRGLDVDGLKCMDVDECLPGLNQCSHTCKNVNAGHVCLCPAGMVIGDDHKTCADENECLRDPAPCSHTCHNLHLSYSCLCPEHMELEYDNRTCCDIGQCIRAVAEESASSGGSTLLITITISAVVVVLVLVVVVWRALRRTISSNEKVIRAIGHGDIPDIYYNRGADSMELETRGLGLAATASRGEETRGRREETRGLGASRAEPYHTFQRNVQPKSFSITDEEEYENTKGL